MYVIFRILNTFRTIKIRFYICGCRRNYFKLCFNFFSEESKNATRIFNEQISNLQISLDEAERVLMQRVMSPLPRDLDTLQHQVLEHKEFESRLQMLEPDVEQVKETFRSITLKTPQMKKSLEKVLDKWNSIWNTSGLYIER